MVHSLYASLKLTPSIGVGIWSVWTEFDTGVVDEVTAILDIGIRVRYFFILTICLNFLCAGEPNPAGALRISRTLTGRDSSTALICWKIWSVTSQTSAHLGSGNPTKRIIHAVVESGAPFGTFHARCRTYTAP